MRLDLNPDRLIPELARYQRQLLIAGGAGAAASLVGLFLDRRTFLTSYDTTQDDADHNIRLVKLGHGVHNLAYSTALLNIAIEWCNQAKPGLQQVSSSGSGG